MKSIKWDKLRVLVTNRCNYCCPFCHNEGQEKCDVVKEYAITAFPTKVLIGTDGKILVRAVGDATPIDAELQKIFGE